MLTEELGDKVIDDSLTPSVEEWGGEGVLVLHLLLVVALCLNCERDFDALSHVDCSHGSRRRDPSRLFRYDAAPLYDLRRSWLEYSELLLGVCRTATILLVIAVCFVS